MALTMLIEINKKVLLTLELAGKLLSGDLYDLALLGLSNLGALHLGFSRSINNNSRNF